MRYVAVCAAPLEIELRPASGRSFFSVNLTPTLSEHARQAEALGMSRTVCINRLRKLRQESSFLEI